jgi:hypothetical protein
VSSLALIYLHWKAEMLEKTRMLMFSIPTVLLPPLLFLLLSVPFTHDHTSANLGLASYLILAVVSVSLFQFGVVVSNERLSAWDVYLRALPLAPWVRMTARILSALVLTLSSAGCVIVLAVAPGRAHRCGDLCAFGPGDWLLGQATSSFSSCEPALYSPRFCRWDLYCSLGFACSRQYVCSLSAYSSVLYAGLGYGSRCSLVPAGYAGTVGLCIDLRDMRSLEL